MTKRRRENLTRQKLNGNIKKNYSTKDFALEYLCILKLGLCGCLKDKYIESGFKLFGNE